MPHTHDLLAVPADRVTAIRELAAGLHEGMTIALSTHVNADGDGCGSEAALSRLLALRGIATRIVNPTPWPTMYRFLLGGPVQDCSPLGAAALRDPAITGLGVLDISDLRRLGNLAEAVREMTVPKFCIDHHIPGDEPPAPVLVADTRASATGELVYDVAQVLGLPIDMETATALYIAILTDTGGFRFSNTTPRVHAIAAELLARGVDPELMYRRVYASQSPGRVRLLAEALQSLGVEENIGLSWLSLPVGAKERYHVSSEEMDGIVEHPRSIAGTRLAIFFRDLGHGRVKISFRSSGNVDVNALAKQFDGGGHAKASGALVLGSLKEVEARVLQAARAVLADTPHDFTPPVPHASGAVTE
ncbi:MAG: bifunctional oligoribonuclease/PAP phosphatase NrnA [Gemmatimonadaceae bacterium]|nr:bifunctional oligoribonuclease/PAP phosphatase NrnA [Gemmatimonadaceae bacterium]